LNKKQPKKHGFSLHFQAYVPYISPGQSQVWKHGVWGLCTLEMHKLVKVRAVIGQKGKSIMPEKIWG